MKIAQINSTCGAGSTGRIAVEISKLLNSRGAENYIFYSQGLADGENYIKYTNTFETKTEALRSRINGNYGFEASGATKRLITELERIKPEIVHLHNLHSHDINLELLFTYLRRENTKIVWTFHDCWAFTAYCTYFTAFNCEKWKTICGNCAQRKQFSWFKDNSTVLFNKKKALFSGQNMTIVTPSKWLAELVGESFLNKYPVEVIHNGIDLSVFKPRESDFRSRYGITEKKMVLAVANVWEKRKGLDDVLRLAEMLGEDYQVVIVGLSKKQAESMPENIVAIQRTSSVEKLAEIYSAADVFVNPSYEDNFPTVNIEALACGTPVVTYATGGSPESINDSCGLVVPCGDCEALKDAVLQVKNIRPFSSELCRCRAECFNKDEKFEEYIELYERLIQ